MRPSLPLEGCCGEVEPLLTETEEHRIPRQDAPAKAALGALALLLQTEPVAHLFNGAGPRPNPSIERTPSGRLRLPTVTAHVER